MRAAVVQTPGRPPVVGARETPTPGTGQVRVRVAAAPITPLDVLCASGASYFGVPATPYVPGVQGVGTLDDGTLIWFPTGAGMRPGDGGMAEYVVVPADEVLALPAEVAPAAVAALGFSAIAAWMALTWRGGFRPGERVLVLGAGGTVGQVAVQAARLLGAGRVVAVARSAQARARARRLGADAAVGCDAPEVGSLAAAFAAACDGPVDLVIDPVFGLPAAAALRTLDRCGRLVNLGDSAGPRAPFDSATLRSRSLRVLGYTNAELTADQRAHALRTIVGHAVAGRLAVEHDVVPLAEVTEAWSRQAAGHAARRIVLRLA